MNDDQRRQNVLDNLSRDLRSALECVARLRELASDSASEGGTAGNGGTATSEGRALRDEPVPSSVDAPKTSMICWYADDYEKALEEADQQSVGQEGDA